MFLLAFVRPVERPLKAAFMVGLLAGKGKENMERRRRKGKKRA